MPSVYMPLLHTVKRQFPVPSSIQFGVGPRESTESDGEANVILPISHAERAILTWS